MFFRKREVVRRSSPLFMLFRLFLSLVMFLVLGLLVFQAVNFFSGQKSETDPVKLLVKFRSDPVGTALNLVNIDQSVQFVDALLGVKLSQKLPLPSKDKVPASSPSAAISPSGSIILKFAVVSDSHNSSEDLDNALKMAKDQGAKFVIGLGDYTNTGTTLEMEKAKEVFESSILPYYLTAGNHDLWDARQKKFEPVSVFNNVFGSPYQSFIDSKIRFILVYNADEYEGVDTLQMSWLKEILGNLSGENPKLTFVFLHIPLSHPSSDKVMGQITKGLVNQKEELLTLFKQAKVAEIFAGHIHSYGRYQDPETGLRMTVAGAASLERNFQNPRFLMVDVYENGGYNISDLEIK